MKELSNTARQNLVEITQNYHASLPEKKIIIEKAWKQCNSSNTTPQKVEDLRRLVHNLAGSAAMYGYPDLAAKASMFDRRLKKAILEQNIDMDAHAAFFRQLLEVLNAESKTIEAEV